MSTWDALWVLSLLLACRSGDDAAKAERRRDRAERTERTEDQAPKRDPDAPKLGDGRWFILSATVPTLAPTTDTRGKPTKGGRKEDRGGEAIGVFDANRDGRQDILVANGSDFFFVALNRPDPDRGVRFDVQTILDGDADDGVSGRAKGVGLHDLNNDGWMDVWLANQGKGGIVTYKRDPPNDKGLYRSAANSVWLNAADGNGKLKVTDLGIDAAGSKRLALFDDFDGDGHTDAYVSVSSYYGIWYAGGTEPNRLYPGTATGFGPDALDAAFDGDPVGFWTDDQGRSIKNFKGGIARDLDRDGRTDIIAGSIADLWANHELDTCDPKEDGYQGGWDRGLYIFQNLSSTGKLRFRDVSHEATAVSWGHEGEGHVHSVIAIDIDHDADLDIIASGNKGMLSHGTLEHNSPIIRVLRNDSTPGHIVLTDVTDAAGLGFMNTKDQLPAPYPITATEFGVTQTLFPAMMAGVPLDIQNDGHADLVMVDRQTFSEDPESGKAYGLGAWVFLGDGRGGFRLAPTTEHGIAGTARDVSSGDFDGDGRVDLVFVDGSTGGQYVSDDNRVWLNRVDEGNRWLAFTVDEPGNRFGIGARLRVSSGGATLGYDEVRTDFNYRSKRDAVVFLGVGKTETIDLDVTFRDGGQVTIPGLPTSHRWRIVRSATTTTGGVTFVRGDGRVDLAKAPGEVRDADGDGTVDLVQPAPVVQIGDVLLVTR